MHEVAYSMYVRIMSSVQTPYIVANEA